MKVELQAGGSITIPQGCKAVIKDGNVVFEKEEKKQVQEFKDGDILAIADYVDTTCPFIYKNTDERGFHYYYVGVDVYNQLIISKTISNIWDCNLRYATEGEKQLLFDKMKEQGLKWNAEEKRVEKIRWRAKKGENYYFLNSNLAVRSVDEDYSAFDNEVWDAFNHFRKEEQAKEAAKRVKETLRKYHEEIGE